MVWINDHWEIVNTIEDICRVCEENFGSEFSRVVENLFNEARDDFEWKEEDYQEEIENLTTQLDDMEYERDDLEKQRDELLNYLTNLEVNHICDESIPDYCDKHCKFDSPQKECYLEYIKQKG